MAKQVLLSVTGMTCPHCVMRVTKALRAVAGVTSAEVDLASGLATVAGQNLDPAALVKAVVEAGYQAGVKQA